MGHEAHVDDNWQGLYQNKSMPEGQMQLGGFSFQSQQYVAHAWTFDAVEKQSGFFSNGVSFGIDFDSI